MARSVPLSRFKSRVGGGSAFFVRHLMRSDTKYYLCTGLGIAFPVIVCLIYLICCILFHDESSVAEHIIGFLVFPFIVCGNHIISPLPASILLFVALLEWPVYGIILANGWVHSRFSRYVFILAIVHLMVVIFTLWFISIRPRLDYQPQWHM